MAGFEVTIEEEKEARSLDFSITSPGVSVPDMTRDLMKIVNATELVARHLNFDFYTALSLLDLNSGYPEVFLLEAFFAGMAVRAGVTLAEQIMGNRKSAIVTFPALKFGQKQYFFAFAILGLPVVTQSESGDTSVIIESKDMSILQRWVLRSEEVNTFSAETAENAATRILNAQGIEDIVFVPWVELRRPAQSARNKSPSVK